MQALENKTEDAALWCRAKVHNSSCRPNYEGTKEAWKPFELHVPWCVAKRPRR